MPHISYHTVVDDARRKRIRVHVGEEQDYVEAEVFKDCGGVYRPEKAAWSSSEVSWSSHGRVSLLQARLMATAIELAVARGQELDKQYPVGSLAT